MNNVIDMRKRKARRLALRTSLAAVFAWSMLACSSPAEPEECESTAGQEEGAVRVLNCTEVAILVQAIDADIAPRFLPTKYVDIGGDARVVDPGETRTLANEEITGDYRRGQSLLVFVYEVRDGDRAVLDRSVGVSGEDLRRHGFEVAIK